MMQVWLEIHIPSSPPSPLHRHFLPMDKTWQMSAGPTNPIIAPTNNGFHQSNSDSDTATVGVGRSHSDLRFDASHPLYKDLVPADSYQDGVYWVGAPGRVCDWARYGLGTFLPFPRLVLPIQPFFDRP